MPAKKAAPIAIQGSYPTLERVVAEGGGKLLSISMGMVTFVDEETGGRLVLPVLLTTRKRVAHAVAEYRAKSVELKRAA